MYKKKFFKNFFKPNQSKLNFKLCLAVHDLVSLYNTDYGLHKITKEIYYEH